MIDIPKITILIPINNPNNQGALSDQVNKITMANNKDVAPLNKIDFQ